VNYNAFPKVIYTTPEIAEIGNLDNKNKNITLLKYELKDNDRAIAGKDREGFIKIAVGKKGRIVGASIVATHAGELLTPWIIAINSKLSIKDMASFIAPYPTLSEASKRVAGSYYAPALYGARTKKIVRFLMRIF
jgi:pyruvate/2-oxoglutarate dehydrogenase complex dihydrolipoamide dehydrogenase (E3) component